ncbi:MAG: nitrilase-related carbon-nitrogen hydrolase, partial [Pseudomonadota bacterium]
MAQINPTVGDLIGNAEKILGAIEESKDLGADIVVFPEQVVTGYPAQDLLLHPDF